jgi:hypothetical protein
MNIPELNQKYSHHSLLSHLASKHGTDKMPNCPIYERYLSSIRHVAVNFLEIGVGGYDDPNAGGASARMWEEYFPNGNIFALDYHDKSPHATKRIRIYRGDQSDAALLKKIADDMGIIDVVLDDGSHRSDHVIMTFNTLFPRLKAGGLYIIEDTGTSYWTDHNGSPDLEAKGTSMNFFKSLTDGINSFAFRHEYTASYYDENIEYLHFYRNFIVIQKR